MSGHPKYPYLDYMTAQERFDFLCESGDVDDYAVLDLALLRGTDAGAVLEELHARQWVLVRPWDLEPDQEESLERLRSIPGIEVEEREDGVIEIRRVRKVEGP